MKNKIFFVSFVLLFCLVPSVLAGTVSYYDFEDGSGSTLTDQWGSNDGTISGMSWDDTTYPIFNISGSGANYSGSFDGSNDYVDTGMSTSSWQTYNNITISSWIKSDIINYGEDGNIINAYGVVYYGVHSSSSNKLRFKITDSAGGSGDIYSNNAITTSWTHFVGVWDGTNVKMYVNGVLQTETDTTTTNSLLDYTTDIEIGGQYSYASGVLDRRYFDGNIDEIKIWDEALNSTEVKNLYNQGIKTYVPPSSSSTSERFDIICQNSTGGSINNCNATIDSTDFYSTTNGTIHTSFYDNETTLHNIVVESENFFTQTYNNYNVSSDLTTSFLEYPKIYLVNYNTHSSLDTWNVEIDGVNYSTTTGGVHVPFNTTKNVKTWVANYIQRSISHDFTDQTDLNASVWQSEINVFFNEKVTGNTLSNWELWNSTSKLVETTGTSAEWKSNAGFYDGFVLKSKDSSFPNRYLVNNITVNAEDVKDFNESFYLFDYVFNGVDENRIEEAVTVPFNYTLDIVDNSSTSRYYDLNFYVDEVLYETVEDLQNDDLVTFNLSSGYTGEHNLSFELVDEYGRESEVFTDEVLFYGTVITINFLTEEGENIDLSGSSFFSCTDVYDVSSTSSPVTYYLECVPEWYRFNQDNTSMSRKITVEAGIYSTNIYLFDGTEDSFVVKPVEVGDMNNEDIYIIRNGNIIHIEKQDALSRIYPMLRVGYEYDVAYKSGSELITIGNFIPLDDDVFLLFANTYSLDGFDSSFYQDVDIEYGFTNTNSSIYVRINDSADGLDSARVRIYYYNNSYIESFDSSVSDESEILFLHPLNDVEKSLINETDFKIVIDLVHDDYGSKTLTYYTKKTNKLIFSGVGDVLRIGFSLIVLVVVLGLFSKVHEGLGVVLSSALFMLFNILGFISFNTFLVYGIGSLFFIMGLFVMIKKGGVMT